jgi:Protein of unknown function (DUF3987)
MTETVRYARGRHTHDAYPEQRTAVSFEAFADAVLRDRSRTKGQAWFSAPFKPNSDGRHHRCSDGVLPRRFLAFDLDGSTPNAFAELCMYLGEYHGFAYTTASHTAKSPHARFILELSRPVDRAEGIRLGEGTQRRIEARLGSRAVRLDPSVYRGEQPCFCPLVGVHVMRYGGDPIDVDAVLATAPNEEPRARRTDEPDPYRAALLDQGLVLRELGPGKDAVTCPFAEEHSEATSDTSTVYFWPRHGGYQWGGIHCLHAHCAERNKDQRLYIEKLGIEPRSVWRGQEGDVPPLEVYGDDAAREEREKWPDPQPLTVKVASEPYPLDALPEIVRGAVTEVKGFVKAPVPLVASSALTAMSVATQAHIDVRRARKLEGPTSLFMLPIADSGERKTTCDNFFTKVIREFEAEEAYKAKEKIQEYDAKLRGWTAEREGIEAAIRTASKTGKEGTAGVLKQKLIALEKEKPEQPRVPKLLRMDSTPEHLAWALAKEWPSAGVVSSEGGIVFGAHAMSKDSIMRNLALLNILWDGGVLSVGRKTSESFTVRQARLTVGLQVQEAALRSFFDRSDGLPRGTGFLARFLVSWPESTQGFRPFTEAPEEWPALAIFNRRIAQILAKPVPIDEDGALKPAMMELSPGAKTAWVKFYDDIEGLLKAGGELYDVRDVASKVADNAVRLAGLFQVFEHGWDSEIKADVFVGASRIAAWHVNESRRFFGELALPAGLENAARLDNWLIECCRRERSYSVGTMRVQQYGPSRLREKAAIDLAVHVLDELGRARLVSEGRRRRIEVNPALVEDKP